MRHIGANFFRQLKNKHLMNKHLMDMFKRLCKEINQQTMMLGLVLLKLALQVMLRMEDLRLHQGVGDVAD
jgi:hypothetical protein